MAPTNAEVIFWLAALAIAVVVVIVLKILAKKVSDDYAESWRDDDVY